MYTLFPKFSESAEASDWCWCSFTKMWSRDMPREERIRSSRTPSTMEASSTTTSSSHNFQSSSTNSSPIFQTGGGLSPDFGKAARSSHGANGGVDFGGKLVIDERTPLSSFKENNRSNNNNNIIGNVTIKQTPEGLPRIKTKKIDETQRSTFGWRDFCPGAVSVVVAFFLFSAANVVWKSGKAEEWYEQFRGHARYVGPATCFRDAKLSEEHCLSLIHI